MSAPTLPKYKQEALEALELVRAHGIHRVTVRDSMLLFEKPPIDIVLGLAKLGKPAIGELTRLISEAKGSK